LANKREGKKNKTIPGLPFLIPVAPASSKQTKGTTSGKERGGAGLLSGIKFYYRPLRQS